MVHSFHFVKFLGMIEQDPTTFEVGQFSKLLKYEKRKSVILKL